jgi:hypothetical protein
MFMLLIYVEYLLAETRIITILEVTPRHCALRYDDNLFIQAWQRSKIPDGGAR